MSRMRKAIRTPLVLAAAGLALAACGDQPPVAPSLTPSPGGPQLQEGSAFNDAGQCMVDDVNSYTPGGPTNCTANDIRIATAYPTAGGTLQCVPGGSVTLGVTAELEATSNAERQDIGVWISRDGGNARTGSCNHYNLPGNPLLANTVNGDGDQCAGMSSAPTPHAILSLGVLTLQCNDIRTIDGQTFLHVGSCVAWTVPGQDGVCADDRDGNGTPGQFSDFRAATVPGTPAKCNCEGFDIAVEVVGKIRIVKVTSPASDPQDFSFTHNVGTNSNPTVASPFLLDTDAGSATPTNTQLFDNVHAGTYTFTEAAVAGWSLTGRSCVLTGTATAANFSTVAGGVSLVLGQGQDVTCTFTNTKQASITVTKTCVGGTGATFGYTGTVPGGGALTGFNLNCGQSSTVVPATTTFGAYTVDESTVPTGWSFTSLSCSGGGGNTTTSGTTASIGLDAGEAVTCTYTNTKQAQLRIAKVTDPTGDPTSFTFTPSGYNGGATFNLTDGQTNASGFLAPGTYGATETVPTGWTLTGRACVLTGTTTAHAFTSTTDGVSVVLGAGEDVTCTFTNTTRAALTIVKATVPAGSPQAFTFTPSNYDGGTTFNLTDGQSHSSGPIVPGTYGATETVPAGWALTGRACVLTGTTTAKSFTSTTNGVSVALGPGENVTCTFTNTAQVVLRIKKVTVPSGSAQSFTFTKVNYNGGSTFNLTDGQTNQSGYLAPGTYGATETVPAGWALTGRACVLTGTTTAKSFTSTTNGVSVALAAGQDVTCTFTNTELATLIVSKVITNGGTQLFDFTRATMPAGVPGSFSLTNGQSSSTGKTLLPGTYTVCELNIPVGWTTSVTVNGVSVTPTNPDLPQDLGKRCVSSGAIAAGGTATVVWTNTPPPGGNARTIGYWRNWSSCTGGQQFTKALQRGIWNKTLDGNLPQTVGLLTLAGAGALNGTSPDCAKAVNILSKRDLTGAIRASDPLFNMAAQQLAAQLNITANADPKCIQPVITLAQALLVAHNWNGYYPYSPALTATEATTANGYATLLDRYNNNTLVCPIP